jgi:hypothetical protein
MPLQEGPFFRDFLQFADPQLGDFLQGVLLLTLECSLDNGTRKKKHERTSKNYDQVSFDSHNLFPIPRV